MREQTDYYHMVGLNVDEGPTVYMLDYTFYSDLHDNPFNGAVGTAFAFISEEEYYERMLGDLTEYPGTYDASKYRDITPLQWLETSDAKEFEEFVFDNSYADLHDQVRAVVAEKLGDESYLDTEKYPVIECVGGGRMFDEGTKDGLTHTWNDELWTVIAKAEGFDD